jgi:hypothetical protein
MNVDNGIGTREQILLAEILWHYDSILLKMSTCIGDGARQAIVDLGGDSSTSILGAETGDMLITSYSGARDVDDNVLAKGGGNILGSIDDSAVQLTVTSNGDSSTAWRVSTSTCTAVAQCSHIRIGSGRR